MFISICTVFFFSCLFCDLCHGAGSHKDYTQQCSKSGKHNCLVCWLCVCVWGGVEWVFLTHHLY